MMPSPLFCTTFPPNWSEDIPLANTPTPVLFWIVEPFILTSEKETNRPSDPPVSTRRTKRMLRDLKTKITLSVGSAATIVAVCGKGAAIVKRSRSTIATFSWQVPVTMIVFGPSRSKPLRAVLMLPPALQSTLTVVAQAALGSRKITAANNHITRPAVLFPSVQVESVRMLFLLFFYGRVRRRGFYLSDNTTPA